MEIALYSIESGVLRLSCHAWVKAVLGIITGDESWHGSINGRKKCQSWVTGAMMEKLQLANSTIIIIPSETNVAA